MQVFGIRTVESWCRDRGLYPVMYFLFPGPKHTNIYTGNFIYFRYVLIRYLLIPT